MSKLNSTIPKKEIPYDLPDNWVWYYWGDIIMDYQQGLIRSNNQLGNSGVDYFKMNNIREDGTYSFDNLAKTEASIEEVDSYVVKEDDFFINVRNSKELVGKSCVISRVDRPILFNHMLIRIYHKNYISNYFINAYFNVPSSKKLIERCKKGTTTVIALYQADLYKIPVAIPDIDTHNKVTTIYKSIANKIELNNRINAELEAMAKTLYDYWFVQFDFPDANGKPYKSSGGKMAYNEELKREIPKEWKVRSLFETSSVQYGFPFSTEHFNEEKCGLPIIRIRDIIENTISNYSTEENINEKYQLRIGDLLIGMDGNFHINHWSLTNCYLNQRVARIRKSFISTLILKCQIEPYIKLREQSVSRTTVGHLSDKDLKAIKITIPIAEKLKQFNDCFDSLLEKKLKNQQENQQLASLRDWLLPMLMNGQVGFKEEYQEQVQTVSVAAEATVEYKPSKTKNDNFHKIQSVYAVLWANSLLGVQQGEMATAKDLYLVDRIAQIDTGFTYAQHNWGSFDPSFKKTINNKQYFARRNFPNSKAFYCDTDDDGYLLNKIPEEIKEKVKSSMTELHNKIFTNYFGKKKAEMKELYATVLKCIEDTQSTDFAVIRQAMTNWKTPKQDFPNKAVKFSEQLTREALDGIIREGWDKKLVMSN